MKAVKQCLLCVICFLICVISSYASEESLTITTYYPSPYGSYRELRSQRIAIGETYISGSAYCWEGETDCISGGGKNVIPSATDLVVEGNVGIGISNPSAKLHIPYGLPENLSKGVVYFDNAGANTTSTLTLGDSTLSSSRYILRAINDSDGDGGGPNEVFAIKADGNIAWSGDHSRDGYIRMGNMQICWGNGVAQGQGMIGHTPGSPSYIVYSDLTFPSGCVFNNSTYSLTANPTSTSGNAKAFVGPFLISPGTTGATLYFHKISDTAQEEMTSTGPVPYSWMAIGTWR